MNKLKKILKFIIIIVILFYAGFMIYTQWYFPKYEDKYHVGFDMYYENNIETPYAYKNKDTGEFIYVDMNNINNFTKTKDQASYIIPIYKGNTKSSTCEKKNFIVVQGADKVHGKLVNSYKGDTISDFAYDKNSNNIGIEKAYHNICVFVAIKYPENTADILQTAIDEYHKRNNIQ